MHSWKDIPNNSDFSIYNIPFGVFSISGGSPRLASAIGDEIIDLKGVAATGIFDSLDINSRIWDADTLNPFISLGKSVTNKVRTLLQEHMCDPSSPLKGSNCFHPMSDVSMHMPVFVGDYTDFYSSIEHATNVGIMFRDPANALMPNWKHLPVGYHGRASSIVVSGTNITRPNGQTKPNDGPPIYGPSQRMDFELEMAFIIGKESNLGDQISTKQADDYIFGMVLFNDWSARDIQKWEYVPLGPFLGKSFGSTASPWIVTMEALSPFAVEGPIQDPEVLPYLTYSGLKNYDINLTVSLTPKDGQANVISTSNFKYMYWNMNQQLAHHTVNGCNVKVGDFMASGTISGKTPESYGSMLEIAWSGQKPITLKDGSQRKFINNYDTVTINGWCEKNSIRVGFGEVSGTILPAK